MINRLNFPGLCCYIEEGPEPDWVEPVPAWLTQWLTSRADADDGGATSNQSFSAEQSARSSNEETNGAKQGPSVAIYDAEWMAWLSGAI